MYKFQFFKFGQHLEIYTNNGKFYFRSRRFTSWSDAIELPVRPEYKDSRFWIKGYWPSK